MKREILLGVVLMGTIPRLSSDLSEDQQNALLEDNLAIKRIVNDKSVMMLTAKGRKVYQALEGVVSIVSSW